MTFSIQQHKLSQLASRLNLMVVLVFGLLITNILMGSLVWYTTRHQKIEITPFSGSMSYTKNDSMVDTNYLMMMSENFIYSRLNVTAETVGFNHKRILTYVSPAHYRVFENQLHQEAQVIQSKKIASHFHITGMTANSQKLSCAITGILKRSVGIRELPDERLTYILTYRYKAGRLEIVQFTHEKQEKNHG
jgi:conjugal transfer pilus assembly protein TraE